MAFQTTKSLWASCIAAAACVGAVQICRAAEPAEVLLVGQQGRRAELVAIEEPARLRFRDVTGDIFVASCDELVRWSTPARARATDEVLLADGSRIGLAAAWGREPSVVMEGKTVRLRTARLGRVELERVDLAAIVWGLPLDVERRTAIADELSHPDVEARAADVLWLTTGDRYAGDLISIEPLNDGQGQQSAVRFRSSLGEVVLPLDRVRGVSMRKLAQRASAHHDGSPAGRESSATNAFRPQPTYLAGLDDGSTVAASSIKGDGDHVVLQNELIGDCRVRLSQIVSIQSLGPQIVYLSDREPDEYDFQPYLNLAWPYQPDRSVVGSPLLVDRQIYLKGLGVHSGATLTFALDGQFNRFAAAAAVDDAAAGGGSAVVRVLLQDRGGTWAEAVSTGTLRAGRSVEFIAVPLGDAVALRLAVDYADRGDERDYVDLLDARLERTSGAGRP